MLPRVPTPSFYFNGGKMKTKKKMSTRDSYDVLINDAIKDIKKLENKHTAECKRLACARYSNKRREERKLEKQIKEKERALNELRSKRK